MRVAVLIATRDRPSLLTERCIPSVLRQTVPPHHVVVVNDGSSLPPAAVGVMETSLASRGIGISILRNSRIRGAGGAWNSGLAHLADLRHEGFVAIIDDDDHWSEDHLAANQACSDGANVVVSGLRMEVGGQVVARPLIRRLEPRAFLVGNPGWQGSNTFVRLDLLLAAGGFREGLSSLNDRDLAFRLLRHRRTRWRLTGTWTATWVRDTPGNLSTPGSAAKVEGLRTFWALYGQEMSPEERASFLSRAQDLFGIGPNAILGGLPPHLPQLGFPREPQA